MTQELPEGTVTILFTDVVGSTELTNRLGDEVAREVLGGCDELVRQQVERHRGQEVKSTGDGLMVAFTSARRAIACAVDTQRAIVVRNRRDLSRAVGLRIGLNTGEVIREEGDLFGAMVTAAARIAGHASAGEILISDTVKGLLGPATTVELEERGQVELGGFPQPWRIHAVRWEEAAAAPAYMERTPFVGRETERAELRRCLEGSLRGQGALVMIGGEPGVGKTRLTEELAAEARERGALALVGHCYEMEGAPPYIPFVEIFERAAHIVPPESFRKALGDAAPEVAKLTPEIRRLFPDIGAPLELPPEQERRYLFNCIVEFVERAGRGQPLLLVLEDLHWGDDSTLLLLQHIAQHLGEMPVLVVGTYRDVELDVARPLAKALEDLLRQRLARDMTLRRLPDGDVAAMLRARSGQEPPARLVEVIYRETEGNPFFVEEVFKHLAETGKLFNDEGSWRADLEIGEEEVPRGVRLVIGRRLERLSEECRGVLTTAAIVGRAFSYELLQELADVDEDALLDAVDEAGRAQLVSSAAAGGEALFTFAHEQIRQTLLSTLQLPRRQRLHLRVAEAMERAYAESLEDHATDLAHHLYQAGGVAEPKKTAHYLSLAAEQALASAAFDEALHLHESALSLASEEDRRGRADLLLGRGAALRCLGRWDDALADWEAALAAYEESGDDEAVGRLCRDMSWQLAWTNRTAEGVEVAQRGLTALGEEPSAARCRLLGMIGVNLGLAADYAGALGAIAEALNIAENLGEEGLLGEILGWKAGNHWFFMEPLEAVEAGLRAADLLRSAGDEWVLAQVLMYMQFAQLMLGRLDDVAEIGEELEPLAARIGALGPLASARRTRGLSECQLTADIGAFEEFAKADLELSQRTGLGWRSNSYGFLGLVHFWRGRWDDALESCQEAARLELPGFLAGIDWAGLFLMRAYVGESERALAMLEQQRDGLPSPGQANTAGSWVMLSAAVEGLAVLDERAAAAELYPVVLKGIDTGALRAWGMSSLFASVAGIAAAAGEQWEKAEQHYETALRQAHELPHKLEQPEVRRWYARMLLDRDGAGDRKKARALLGEAIEMYTKIGMPKHVEMAEAMLGEV